MLVDLFDRPAPVYPEKINDPDVCLVGSLAYRHINPFMEIPTTKRRLSGAHKIKALSTVKIERPAEF